MILLSSVALSLQTSHPGSSWFSDNCCILLGVLFPCCSLLPSSFLTSRSLSGEGQQLPHHELAWTCALGVLSCCYVDEVREWESSLCLSIYSLCFSPAVSLHFLCAFTNSELRECKVCRWDRWKGSDFQNPVRSMLVFFIFFSASPAVVRFRSFFFPLFRLGCALYYFCSFPFVFLSTMCFVSPSFFFIFILCFFLLLLPLVVSPPPPPPGCDWRSLGHHEARSRSSSCQHRRSRFAIFASRRSCWSLRCSKRIRLEDKEGRLEGRMDGWMDGAVQTKN